MVNYLELISKEAAKQKPWKVIWLDPPPFYLLDAVFIDGGAWTNILAYACLSNSRKAAVSDRYFEKYPPHDDSEDAVRLYLTLAPLMTEQADQQYRRQIIAGTLDYDYYAER